MSGGIYNMEDTCLDCGAKISPGWDFCQTCGSIFADQEGRTVKEQHVIDRKIRKRQNAKKQEFRSRQRETRRKVRHEKFERNKNKIILIVSLFFIISLVSGIIGWSLMGGSGFGFVLGFFAPLIISLAGLYIWDEYIG